MLVAALGQIWFFLRATRHGGVPNYASAVLLAFAVVAASFSAALIFWAEGFWLIHRAWRPGLRAGEGWSRQAVGLATVLTATGAILTVLLPPHLEIAWYRG